MNIYAFHDEIYSEYESVFSDTEPWGLTVFILFLGHLVTQIYIDFTAVYCDFFHKKIAENCGKIYVYLDSVQNAVSALCENI